MKEKKVSVIIPTFNEEKNIEALLNHLWKCDNNRKYLEEIIVVDAQSTDKTIKNAEKLGAKVIKSNIKNRGVQMNEGAQKASGTILHFMHADIMPPSSCVEDVVHSINDRYKAGCFRSRFNTKNKFLLLNTYFTRFKGIIFRGGGQTLFVAKEIFDAVGGYNEQLLVMEEYDLILKIQKKTKFRVIPKNVLVSARKFEQNGPVSTQLIFILIYIMYFLGFSQSTLVGIYKKIVKD